MALLGTGEEENDSGACSTLSGDAQSILEHSLSLALVTDNKLPLVSGAIPERESPAELLGRRV